MQTDWKYTRHFAWLPVRSSRKDKRQYIWFKHYWHGQKWSPNPLVDFRVKLDEKDFFWWILAERDDG